MNCSALYFLYWSYYMENIVYMELLRRGYQVTVGKSGEREVDFIGTRQKDKLYIQVSYLLASDDTISREF